MVEHLVYTEGVGSSSLSSPKYYGERFSKENRFCFWGRLFASLLYYCYSNELVREIDSNQGERQFVFELHFSFKRLCVLEVSQSSQ